VLAIESYIMICSGIAVAAATIGIRLFWRHGKQLEDL